MGALQDELKKVTKITHERFRLWQVPQGQRKVVAIIIVGLLLAVGGYLTYITGGTQNVYVHLMYLPIILGAFFFHIPGGVITGLLADLIVGPYMPVLTTTGQQQLTANWVTRGIIFCFIGGFIGVLFHLLQQRMVTIENILNRLTTTYTQTLKSFASIVTGRDEQTGGHCERVALNACIIGKAMSMDDQVIEGLYWAGLLHDLGKIAIPESVLLKPETLTADEMEIIRKHSQIGAEIIKVISPEFNQIARGIATHHERWDGSGYPEGIKGEDISIIGRILAIVDVFEALSSKRPYRDPLGSEEALQYLLDNSGTHFDPNIVAVFVSLFRQNQIFIQDFQESPISQFQANLGSLLYQEELQSSRHFVKSNGNNTKGD